VSRPTLLSRRHCSRQSTYHQWLEWSLIQLMAGSVCHCWDQRLVRHQLTAYIDACLCAVCCWNLVIRHAFLCFHFFHTVTWFKETVFGAKSVRSMVDFLDKLAVISDKAVISGCSLLPATNDCPNSRQQHMLEIKWLKLILWLVTGENGSLVLPTGLLMLVLNWVLQ